MFVCLFKGEECVFDGWGGKLYVVYQCCLLELNVVDFGDLLMYCVIIFQVYFDVLCQWQDRFCYIFVDEYQDMNVV